uniref:Uncharacterized protein n=1 Tax=Opuntia streptacantha TaxID=393608 RepID=A0A7C9E2U8_OPUST
MKERKRDFTYFTVLNSISASLDFLGVNTVQNLTSSNNDIGQHWHSVLFHCFYLSFQFHSHSFQFFQKLKNLLHVRASNLSKAPKCCLSHDMEKPLQCRNCVVYRGENAAQLTQKPF